jgi:hypothetical protein
MTVSVAAPSPEFAVLAVTPDPFAATPLLRFELGVTEASGREIYTIALTALIQIDADRRAYDPETRGQLLDLFGVPERLPTTAGAVPFARVDALVPSFSSAGTCTLPVAITADLEQASARYLASLESGVVPLTFNFNGTIFYCGEHDRLQVVPVPWSCSARYRLRVAVWRDLIEKRHAASGFLRLQAPTLALLRRRRAERGFPTLETTIAELLEGEEE